MIYTYLQFKQAAKKHYYTCKCLYKNCNNDWQIQENIFYLCGYVIEMIIKYQIFRRINYDRNKDIKDINFNGISYNEIKTHNIRRLIETLRKYENSVIFDDILNYYSNWDVVIRYNGKKNDKYENIDKLIDVCRKLIELYGG